MQKINPTGPGAAVWYLVRLGLVTGRRLEGVLGGHGLTPPEAMMLRRAVHSEDPKVLALAGECGLTASTAVGVLDRLEKSGLARRERDADDRRVVRVVVTERGREVAAAVPELAAQLEAEVTAGFSAAERKTLRELLARVYEQMVAATPELETRLRAEAMARWIPKSGRRAARADAHAAQTKRAKRTKGEARNG